MGNESIWCFTTQYLSFNFLAGIWGSKESSRNEADEADRGNGGAADQGS